MDNKRGTGPNICQKGSRKFILNSIQIELKSVMLLPLRLFLQTVIEKICYHFCFHKMHMRNDKMKLIIGEKCCFCIQCLAHCFDFDRKVVKRNLSLLSLFIICDVRRNSKRKKPFFLFIFNLFSI